MPILSDTDRSDLAVQVKTYIRNGRTVKAYQRGGGGAHTQPVDPKRTTTRKNKDGSVTERKVRTNGTVVEKTTKKDGSSETVEINASGHRKIIATTKAKNTHADMHTRPDGARVTEYKDGSVSINKTLPNGDWIEVNFDKDGKAGGGIRSDRPISSKQEAKNQKLIKAMIEKERRTGLAAAKKKLDSKRKKK